MCIRDRDCIEGIDVYFSTFAKSMASIGAFFAADKSVLKFLRYNMRSQIYAKSMPMTLVVGALKRLELLRTRPESVSYTHLDVYKRQKLNNENLTIFYQHQSTCQQGF